MPRSPPRSPGARSPPVPPSCRAMRHRPPCRVRSRAGVHGDRAPGASTALTGAGHGAQQHVALAAAGAQVIVAFPALDDAPVGFAVCPVIAVAGSSPLHSALGDDFDLGPDATLEELWAKTLAVLAGCRRPPSPEAPACSRSSASR